MASQEGIVNKYHIDFFEYNLFLKQTLVGLSRIELGFLKQNWIHALWIDK